jgi:four helix bundle protein
VDDLQEGRGTWDEGRGGNPVQEAGLESGRGTGEQISNQELGLWSGHYSQPTSEASIVSESGHVRDFEDLIAWQKARQLTRQVYHVTRNQAFAKDHSLANQIQRACVSIMSNIAEGHERGYTSEFHHYLSNAKGSCAEVRCQLYIALDVGYLDKNEFDMLMKLTSEVRRIIGGLRTAIGARRK